MQKLDLSNKVFGKLTVISLLYTPQITKTQWLCQCECGNITKVRGDNLISKSTLSCGCWRREIIRSRSIVHGLEKDKFYHTWNSMIRRCYNINNISYKNYGGRGIGVCEEWKDVRNFVEWCRVQEPIPKGYTLNRIDNNRDYSPTNCNFVSKKEQAANRRKRKSNP